VSVLEAAAQTSAAPQVETGVEVRVLDVALQIASALVRRRVAYPQTSEAPHVDTGTPVTIRVVSVHTAAAEVSVLAATDHTSAAVKVEAPEVRFLEVKVQTAEESPA
jgi:hypothetical protein